MTPVCATPTSQALEREDFGIVTVLRIHVSLLWGDEKTEELFEEILSLTHSADRANLVLNLGRVVLLGSRALGKLIALMRRVRAVGRAPYSLLMAGSLDRSRPAPATA